MTDTTKSSMDDTRRENINDARTFYEAAPQHVDGALDMVIAFDTTGSMASYIDAVRKEVADLIPRLFADNEDLRLGIVAFGDYCDMLGPQEFGDAYQCIKPTNNENDLIRFVVNSRDTNGGDGDEFYELVLKKIIEETPWRDGAAKSVLLIADADPHPLGYSFGEMVINNQISWWREANKAAALKIKIDTVTISSLPWFRELSEITHGVSVPFKTSYMTGRLIEAAVYVRGSEKAKARFDVNYKRCNDDEERMIYASFVSERYSER